MRTERDWLGEVWQAVSCPRGADAALRAGVAAAVAERPRDAGLLNALAVATLALGGGQTDAAVEAGRAFQDAWAADPRHGVAGLNLAQTLITLGQPQCAADQARRVLEMLDGSWGRHSCLPANGRQGCLPHVWNDPLAPSAFDWLRVEWETAAVQHAGDPAGEAAAKRRLVRWRLRMLLGEVTRDPLHYAEACLLRADVPVSHAALGMALARKGRFADALPHLEEAVRGNPFDNASGARAARGARPLGAGGAAARAGAAATAARGGGAGVGAGGGVVCGGGAVADAACVGGCGADASCVGHDGAAHRLAGSAGRDPFAGAR